MKISREPYQLPPDKQELREKGARVEIIWMFVQASVVITLALILGHSQAMKAAWIDDVLDFIPAIAFLTAKHFEEKPPNVRFPYGYYRAVAIGFLITAMLLTWVGATLVYDSTLKLIRGEHTPIGAVTLFGHQFWFGWLMEIGLAYSIVTELVIGYVKMPIAKKLNDKMLYADAKMNKAGWTSETAAAIGILLIGFGFWWADPVAAIIVSLDILKDGWDTLSQVLRDLMDETPRDVGTDRLSTLPKRMQNELEKMDWVETAWVRLREEGHVYAGEVFVVPKKSSPLTAEIHDAMQKLKKMDWRVFDLTIMPVQSLEGTPEYAPAEHSGEEAGPGKDESSE